MPASRSRTQSSSIVASLLVAFAVLSAILWLLPLLSSHSVLFPAGPNFEDVLVYKGRFTLYHSAAFFTSKTFSAFAYPAGSALIYEAFYETSDAVQTYCLLAFAATVVAVGAAYLSFRRSGTTGLFLPFVVATSFPLVFLIQRANIELVLWLLIATGIVAYRRGFPNIAAILFGIAATTKLYPIIMLGLFLGPGLKRKGQDLLAFAMGVAVFVVGTVFSISYAGPTFSIAARGFFSGVSRFQDHYVDKVSHVEVAFDHCLFSPIKYWAYSSHTSPAPYTHLYLLLAGTLALVLFLRVRRLPSLNRIVFLSAAMVALPPVSFTYTLVHLYVPLLLLLVALASQRLQSSPSTLTALALLLFLMLPLVAISVLHSTPTGPLQSFALLGLMILASLTAWPDGSRVDTA